MHAYDPNPRVNLCWKEIDQNGHCFCHPLGLYGVMAYGTIFMFFLISFNFSKNVYLFYNKKKTYFKNVTKEKSLLSLS